MIVVSGTFQFPTGTRSDVVAAMKAVREKTPAEDGCISYTFYTDNEDQNSYRVFEEWESHEHLDAHLKTEHLGAFRQAIGALKPSSVAVSRYEIASVGPLVRE